MSDAVLDAGPLIHLAELNALDVLSDFDVLRVPPAVWQEVTEHQPKAFSYSGLRLEQTEQQFPSVELTALTQVFSLDRGEIEALALMEKYPQALFLTDDAAARLAAEESGCKVHGTIGLLVRAVRKRHRKPEEVLDLLKNLDRRSSLHIRPVLVKRVIAQLEKEWLRE